MPTSRNSSNHHRMKGRFRLGPEDRSLEQRIGERITVTPDGCWTYNGHLDTATHIKPGVAAHRYIYETLVRPLPPGVPIRPTCGHKGCCNPNHRRLD